MISTAMTIDGVIEVGDWYVGEGEHSRAAFDMLGSVDAGAPPLQAGVGVRKLIVANMIWLDGFYTGPGGDVMVLPDFDSFDRYNAERLRAADTLLLGRTSYEGFKGYWPPIADDPEASPTHRGRGHADIRGRAAGVAGLLETGTWDGSDNVLLRYAARRESE